MLHRFTRTLTAAVMTLAVGGVAFAADPPALDTKALDKSIVASLREVHDRGADLYNLSKDYTGAYRMYEGGLVAVKPLLAHRADIQKAIDAGLSSASREADVARKAFLLHETIEKVRAELKGVASPKKPADTSAKPKEPEPVAKGGASVSGKVTFNGKPLTDGTVLFASPDKKQAKQAAATIQADGTYAAKDLVPGKYLVAISGEKVKTPAKYAATETSGLTVEVKAGANTLDFDLK